MSVLDLGDRAGVDSRMHRRAPLFVSVDVESEHNFWTGLTLDISEGGVFVATHASVPVGSILVVNLTLPGSTTPITAATFVRWTRVYCEIDEIPPGLGLKFVGLEPRAAARIRKFVRHARTPMLFEDAES